MALPNFFIIGAAKAGTTSLRFYLDQHPEIQMSAIKEPNFFSGPAGPYPYPVGRVEGRDEYEALFDATVPRRGEASPSYSSAPRRRGVPEAIRAAVPEARFVYVVRDPIDRILSQYQMLLAAGKARGTLDAALEELRAGADPHLFHLTCQSFYAFQLELYLAWFAPESALVVDQQDLRDRRDEVLREIFAFLAVEPEFESDAFADELFQGGDRAAYPDAFNRFAKPALRPLVRHLPEALRDRLRAGAEQTMPSVPRPTLSPAAREYLQAVFAPDAGRLRELTGKRFATWSV